MLSPDSFQLPKSISLALFTGWHPQSQAQFQTFFSQQESGGIATLTKGESKGSSAETAKHSFFHRPHHVMRTKTYKYILAFTGYQHIPLHYIYPRKEVRISSTMSRTQGWEEAALLEIQETCLGKAVRIEGSGCLIELLDFPHCWFKYIQTT